MARLRKKLRMDLIELVRGGDESNRVGDRGGPSKDGGKIDDVVGESDLIVVRKGGAKERSLEARGHKVKLYQVLMCIVSIHLNGKRDEYCTDVDMLMGGENPEN